MARLARRAENDWVGVQCGIMDQLTSAAGHEGHALLIDCRSLEARPVTLACHTSIVVLDTATRRGLVDSAYNERRLECERAARQLGERTLRDVDLDLFRSRECQLEALLRARARHVVTENARTLSAAAALDRGDLETVGRLMNESHASLRDDFEVSGRELDVMARLAQEHPACLGARMTGAGFGGCVVALVSNAELTSFIDAVAPAYEREVGLRPTVHACKATRGASVELRDAPADDAQFDASNRRPETSA
jgi:galactokinase